MFESAHTRLHAGVGVAALALLATTAVPATASAAQATASAAQAKSSVTSASHQLASKLKAGDGLFDVAFAGASHGWAAGLRPASTHASAAGQAPASALMVSTTDGGRHWGPQKLPGGLQVITRVRFADGNNGAAAATTVANLPSYLTTANGGTTWTAHAVPGATGYAAALALPDAKHGWIAVTDPFTLNSTLWATASGGAAFVAQAPGVPSVIDIAFSDSRQGWAAGSTGYPLYQPLIRVTSDGGATWTPAALPSDITDIQSLDRVGASTGWATGDSWVGPALLHSTDSGATWQHVAVPASASAILAASFADATHGWVSAFTGPFGSGAGMIFATADGGSTWSAQPVAPAQVYALAAVNTATVFAVGAGACSNPAILRTSNAGKLWTEALAQDPVFGYASAITFVDPQHGWAVGGDSCFGFGYAGHGVVMATADGGTTWRQQRIPGTTVPIGLAFVSTTQGWIIGSTSLLHTTNAGASWTLAYTPQGTVDDGGFIDAAHGWLVVRTPSGGSQLATTADGGLTWTARPAPLSTFGAIRASFVSPSMGWMAVNQFGPQGPVASILYTTDGGATWTGGSAPPALQVVQLHFADALHGLAVGDGTLWRSVDGGHTWTVATVPAGVPAFGVMGTSAQPDAAHAWYLAMGASSASEQMLQTTDGGATWTAKPVASGGVLTAISFLDATHGWGGFVFGLSRTNDGGGTWSAGHLPARLTVYP